MSWRIITADVMDGLKSLPDASVHCCVTSPPFWGLRDYGVDGQLGLEPTPEAYVENMVRVFREVRRVLRDDGTLWLNLGDSYAANRSYQVSDGKHKVHDYGESNAQSVPPGLKPKDLVGIPWRVAFALQADGWWLRSDIIWAKPNPMPESVRDRPTKAHEYIFLLTKSARYFYDSDAVAEDAVKGPSGSHFHTGKTAEHHLGRSSDKPRKQDGHGRRHDGSNGRYDFANPADTRNRRTVWTIATRPFAEAHFAVFPPELPEICIKAECPKDGTVLDPFAGAGTTLMVALRLGRNAIGIELNPTYAEMARQRIDGDCPLFNREDEAEAQRLYDAILARDLH